MLALSYQESSVPYSNMVKFSAIIFMTILLQVSIRAHGVNGETPFAFAGVAKQLKFHWTAGNMNIQSLSSVYVEVSVVIKSCDHWVGVVTRV